MTKKFFTLFFALVASVGTMFAEQVQIGDLYYNLDATNQTAEVTSQNSSYPFWSTTIKTANIPSSVEYNGVGYSVTSIGNYAFYECSSLTSVTIPNSVTSIGDDTFLGCSGLTSPVYNAHVFVFMPTTYSGAYTIPDGIESIAGYAFYECSSLTSVTIPNSVTSIGNYAFYECSGLTSPVYNAHVFAYMPTSYSGAYTIPDGIESIAGGAFDGCSGLTSVTIPNSVTSIGGYAFYYCTGLTSVTIPNSVTSIGYGAFYRCKGLTSVTIPNSVTSIGYEAFSGCSGLTSIEIPNSVTSIGDDAFRECTGLTSVTIPNSVTSIGEHAFYNCNNITSVIWNAKNCAGYNFGSQVTSFTFGDEVEVIPEGLCAGMTKLTSVTIPNRVTSIGNDAFRKCSGLTKVNITDIAAWCNIAFSNYWDNPLFYAQHLYVNDVEVTNLVIPEGVTSIGDYAFYDCSGLTSVTIPNSVTSIGEHAFYSCSSLTSVTIPNSVTSIGEWAFSSCHGLTSVTIGNNVTSIGEHAFYNCSGLTSVTIPNSVTSIGKNAFCMCGLTSVTIGNSVTSIGDGAFYYCSSLIKVNITDIAAWCNIAFSDDDSNPLHYANHLYVNDVEVTNLVIPEGVTSIGVLAFWNCSGLTSVTIPNSVTSIGDYAFYGCSGLTSVTIEAETPPTLGKNAFYNTNKCPIYVPCNAVNAYKTAWSEYADRIVANCSSFTITFVNWDGSNLQTTSVTEGEMPQYTGSTPTRPDDEEYTYTFSGWTPAIVAATEDATYTANYTATPKSQGINQITNDKWEMTNKIIRDGNVLILRGEKVYTVTGQEVK